MIERQADIPEYEPSIRKPPDEESSPGAHTVV